MLRNYCKIYFVIQPPLNRVLLRAFFREVFMADYDWGWFCLYIIHVQ